jgi:hypothetical protein
LLLYFNSILNSCYFTKAAKEIGVGTTTLKNVCRKKGITRWPYQKLSSFDKKLSDIQNSYAIRPDSSIFPATKSTQMEGCQNLKETSLNATMSQRHSEFILSPSNSQTSPNQLFHTIITSPNPTSSESTSFFLPSISILLNSSQQKDPMNLRSFPKDEDSYQRTSVPLFPSIELIQMLNERTLEMCKRSMIARGHEHGLRFFSKSNFRIEEGIFIPFHQLVLKSNLANSEEKNTSKLRLELHTSIPHSKSLSFQSSSLKKRKVKSEDDEQ